MQVPMGQDIVQFIVANIGTWTDPAADAVNGNIFMEQQPTEPDRCVCVYQLAGEKPVRTLGDSYAWENPRLRVTNRASSDEGYGQAEADALAIWNLLKPVVNQTVNGTYYMALAPNGSPAPQLLDPNNRPVYVQEYAVMKHLS